MVNLVNLRGLNLAFNRFTELPAWLADLPALESLDLRDNPLGALPPWLADMPALSELILADEPPVVVRASGSPPWEGVASLAELARRYLPEEAAARWTALLRPAIQLQEGTGAVVGHLGGTPALPDGVDWPTWEGRGPLTYVGELDLTALGYAVGGRLLLFFFDGHGGDEPYIPQPGEPTDGARLVHVPDGVVAYGRDTPAGAGAYRRVDLMGRPIETQPDRWHPAVLAAFPDDGDLLDREIDGYALTDAATHLIGGSAHQVGGHALPIQGPVEDDVALVTGAPVDPAEWALLAQIDSEPAAGMNWGDKGCLYWLIRRDDLAAGRFDAAVFTWQSH
jgi:hypothetical protein